MTPEEEIVVLRRRLDEAEAENTMLREEIASMVRRLHSVDIVSVIPRSDE